MKKSLFVLGVAVAALASCTNEEVLNIAESNAIRFDNAFVGNATKAVTAPEVTTGNIEDMYVFAVDGTGANVFDVNPKNVYKIGGTEEWGYDKPVLWEDTKTYNFIAYAGKELKGETDDKVEQDNTSHKLKFTNITVDGAEGNQFDLVYSTNLVTRESDGSSLDKSPIAFTFEHLLSIVKFTLKSGFGSTTQVAISDFKFYGVKTKESYDATQDTPAWTATSKANDKDNTNFIVTDSETAQSSATEPVDVENSWIIIPQANADGNDPVEMVRFMVTLSDTENTSVNETKELVAKLPKITWQKGNRYNYIFTITPETMEIEDKYITFEAPKVTDWTNDTTLTIDNETSSTTDVIIEGEQKEP